MPEQQSIILFDGVCNLCNSSVNFVIDHDPHKKFIFGSLQSQEGQKLLHQYNVPEARDSIVLIEHGKCYVESTAALRIAKNLNAFWPLLYAFIIIPPFIRNAIYRFIAINRYKWFGKRDSCRISEPGLENRFLE